ncbi:hypothetical protein [Cerasicoccus frondis]|nr:hypothetical protein [Cerasicoccus frondis]
MIHRLNPLDTAFSGDLFGSFQELTSHRPRLLFGRAQTLTKQR